MSMKKKPHPKKKHPAPPAKATDDEMITWLKQTLNILKNTETIFVSGNSKGAYASKLFLPDETEIRVFESTLPLQTVISMRILTLRELQMLPPYAKTPDFFEMIFYQTEDRFRRILSSDFCYLIAGVLPKDSESQVPIAEIYNGPHENIPKSMRNTDIGKYLKDHRRMFYADSEATGVYSCINWEEVFGGENVSVWAKKLMKIFQSVCPEEKLADYENKRLRLTVEAYKAMSEIVSTQLTIDRMLAEETIHLSELEAKDSPSSLQFDVAYYAQAAANEIASDLAKNWAFLSKLDSYSLDEYTYAALFYLSKFKEPKRMPQLLMYICAGEYFRTSVCNIDMNAWDDEENDNPCIINTCEFRKISPGLLEGELKERYEKSVGTAEAWELLPRINLQNIFTGWLTTRIPPYLTFSTTRIRNFIQFGFTKEEAHLLTGYYEGCKGIRSNALLNSFLYGIMTDIEDEEPSEDKDDTSDDSIVVVEKSELERLQADSMEREKALIEEFEQKQRRLEKERRQIFHESKKSDDKVAAKDKELEDLRRQLKEALEERDELQSVILDLSEAVKQDAEDETETGLSFPIHTNAKIVVYGGSENWIAELSSRFPDVSFISAEVKPDETAIAGADTIIVNTFVCSHKFYWVVRNQCRRSGKKMHYIPKPGINNSSEYIASVIAEDIV